jgi:uncharacterized protein
MPFPIKIGISPVLNIRGIISTRNIKKDEIIEICPTLLIKREFQKQIDETPFTNYYFEWDSNHVALLLGFGCLYNHSYFANAKLKEDFKNQTMTICAAKNINKDTEITINYNGYPNSKLKLSDSYLSFDKNL